MLDEELAEAVRLELITAQSKAGSLKVMLDFCAVTSASDAILRPVVRLHDRMQEPGDRLVLCGLTGMASQV